jgi:hypothetical protein
MREAQAIAPFFFWLDNRASPMSELLMQPHAQGGQLSGVEEEALDQDFLGLDHPCLLSHQACHKNVGAEKHGIKQVSALNGSTVRELHSK